jgi:hypothetical protein
MPESGDKCARCGKVGEDRRTIFAACLYAMEETGIPFEQCRITGEWHNHSGYKDVIGHRVATFEDKGTPTQNSFYTVLVCKDCRADFLDAMKQWFFAGPRAERADATIPVRINGTRRMMTPEEYEAMYPGRIPHTLKPETRP